MAETHTKPERVASAICCYTVSYTSDAKSNPLLSVILKECWLEEAVFATSIPIEVKVLQGCLILTVQQPQSSLPPEPEIMQTLRKVYQFSARKQRQVERFIQMIATKEERSLR